MLTRMLVFFALTAVVQTPAACGGKDKKTAEPATESGDPAPKPESEPKPEKKEPLADADFEAGKAGWKTTVGATNDAAGKTSELTL